MLNMMSVPPRGHKGHSQAEQSKTALGSLQGEAGLFSLHQRRIPGLLRHFG